MQTFTSRGGRLPLALTLATIVALGACADNETPVTAPSAQPDKPSLAVGDVITVTSAKGTADAGTLRWAVAQATGGEIIRFDSRLTGATITLDTTLVITKYLTIEGPSSKGITLSGGGKGRVIDITGLTPSRPATKLINLAITGGKLGVEGGAGVRTAQPLTIEHSTIWGNEAGGSSAILGFNGAPLTVVNSTVSGNVSSSGYAISSGGFVRIEFSTIAYNSTGGVWFDDFMGGALVNSIVANNGALNCGAGDNVNYSGTNLSNDTSCGDSTYTLIADPKLGSLRDNGGPGMTHAVTPDSPAFNVVPGCVVKFDQRYKPRDGYCDIGAFESTDSTTVAITIDRVASTNANGSLATVSGTVQCSHSGDQFTLQVTVQQRGPDKTTVEGTAGVSVTCTTSAQAWGAQVSPSTGAFKSGSASAIAVTKLTPTWVAPSGASRSVKLVAPAI